MIVGHDSQIALLAREIDGGRLHHAWLLRGPQGVGKALVARAAAARLLLGPGEGDFPLSSNVGHPLARAFDAGAHPDFQRLERLENDKGVLARNITVDQVRGLRSVFGTATGDGGRRVVLIDPIDAMERGAANALLKMLEEPPASTIFFLVSHSAGRLLPTIRSRCHQLAFAPLPPEQLAQASGALDPALAGFAQGSPGRVATLREMGVKDLGAALQRVFDRPDDVSARMALVDRFGTRKAGEAYPLFLRLVPAMLAQRAREARADRLPAILAQYDRARALSAIAEQQSLPADVTVFRLAGYVAEAGRQP